MSVFGDFNFDNTTNFQDFAVLANHYGQSVLSAAPVPEPSLLALFAAGMLFVKARRDHGIRYTEGVGSPDKSALPTLCQHSVTIPPAADVRSRLRISLSDSRKTTESASGVWLHTG